MAIFHLAVKTISRSKGRSATAAAAYRAGVRIVDSRTGEVHDYRRRSGVISSFIVPPTAAPGWATDRASLWNTAEQAEKRINSTVAREIEIAFPHELDAKMCRELAKRYALHIASRFNVAVDVALHEPNREGDQRNRHAHLLMTTRTIRVDGLAEKTRILDSAVTGSAEIAHLRATWSQMANDALSAAGRGERIDHRSLAAQGRLGPPTRHLGPDLTAVERRRHREARQAGLAYEPGSRRARVNAEIRDGRQAVYQARRELRQAEAAEASQTPPAAARPEPAAPLSRPAAPPAPASVEPSPTLPKSPLPPTSSPGVVLVDDDDWTPAKVPPGRSRRLIGSIADMIMTIRREPARAEQIKPVLALAWREIGVLAEKFRPWLQKMLGIKDSDAGRAGLTDVIRERIKFQELRSEYQAAGLVRPPPGRPGPGGGRRDGPER